MSYTEFEMMRHLREEIQELENLELTRILRTADNTAKVNIPPYKKKTKEAISWILTLNAKMEIVKFNDVLIPRITIRHANFDALHRIKQLTQMGEVGNLRKIATPPFTITKEWRLTHFKQIAHLLREVSPFMTCRRQKRVATDLMKFCDSRLHHLGTEYTTEEYAFATKIQELNKLASHTPCLKQHTVQYP